MYITYIYVHMYMWAVTLLMHWIDEVHVNVHAHHIHVHVHVHTHVVYRPPVIQVQGPVFGAEDWVPVLSMMIFVPLSTAVHAAGVVISMVTTRHS